MTRTVTLQIILVAHEHDLSYDPEKEARRYRRGDIVDVMLTPPHATKTGNNWNWDQPIGSNRLGFVHMRDVPDARWHNMRNTFTDSVHAEEADLDTEALVSETTQAVRRRKWRFQIPQMAAPKRNALLNDKEVTLAWTAARDLIRRKVHTNHLNQSLDNEDNAVQDSDLPGP